MLISIKKQLSQYSQNLFFLQDCESICKYETVKWDCGCMVLDSPHARTYRKGKDGTNVGYCQTADRECIKTAQAKYDEHGKMPS